MAKQHKSTQEMVNVFPPWSRTRSDKTSVGYRLINSFGGVVDKMEESLIKMRKNNYLTTANLDEIDLVYKVALPKTFEFDLDTKDPLETHYIDPTASGLYQNQWYTISLARDNSVEEFWYESVPSRFSVVEAVSGINDQLATLASDDFSVSGIFKHHMADTSYNGGHVWVESVGGTRYVRYDDDKKVFRSRVILAGKTRKGSFEEETMVFAWDSKQRSIKEWEELTSVEIYDMEPGVQVDVRSSDFVAGPYMDFWNTEFSKNRNKIDQFWDLEFISGQPVLSRVEYITDEWQQLLLGFSSKQTVEQWELLDESMLAVSGVDLAVQPFTNRAWLVTDDAKIYCYDLLDDVPDNLDRLKGITPGADIAIEVENPNIVFGQDIEFIPWHANPQQEIQQYTVYYIDPTGTKTILINKTIPEGTQIKRNLENLVSFTPASRGMYVLGFEATFIDGTTHTYKTFVQVRYKQPLVSGDLSSTITDPVEGIEFDSDQQMWIKTITDDIYRVQHHKDLMLVDYDKKIVYFHEPYEEVDIGQD